MKQSQSLRSLLSALVLVLSTLWIPVAPTLAAPWPDEGGPSSVADARRSASSDQAEPSLIVGPAGRTLVANHATTPIGPGTRLTTFDRFDARGWVRGYLLEVDLTNAAISADALFPGAVASAQPLSTMAQARGAIAGVNGDFFDINRTNAPLGAMIQDQALIKGPVHGWTHAVGVGIDRIGRLADVWLDGMVALPNGERALAALNQHIIPRDGIGLFTSAWGDTSRASAVAGAMLVHEVVVRDGKVIATADRAGSGALPEGTFALLGREAGAQALAELVVGDAVGVRYAPRTDASVPLTFSVGGNIVLLRDGRIPPLDDTQSEPRTAVGFSADGSKMFLTTIDGRQRDSRGMTYYELAELLKGFGADDALNLDGGGSATILGRQPGEQHAAVVNSPSDGSERPVPNGIGLFAAPGSGNLSGLKVAPAPSAEHADRAFPGLTRTFAAKGYDETYAPVAADGVTWQALPADVGAFEADGVLRAKKPGSAVVEAQARNVKGSSRLQVLGPLARIETNPGRLGLSLDATGLFGITGYDADGYSAPIEPRDVTLSYDQSLVTIVATDDGGFSVRPQGVDGSTLVTVTVAGKQAFLPITVGLTDLPLADFEDLARWSFSAARSTGAITGAPGRTGQGLRLSYDFTQSTGTRAAYANANPVLAIPGEPQRLGLWVKGDGKGAWLRAVVRDAANVNYTLNLAAEITWTDWRYVETVVPNGVQFPLNLVRIYPVEINPAKQYTGQIVFDDLVARVTPSVVVPSQPVVRDPLIIQNGAIGGNRWTFAVLSDSQFIAADPDSDQVRSARTALRQIVAAQPEFLIIAGDFVDTGYVADFELAARILSEEVGDRLPVYYLPGNHEILGPGTIHNFLAKFGRNRFTFDHRGTRFILLDSSTGSFRTADFQQLVELKQSLEEAARNPQIDNIVVVAHHPTRDPLPTQNSQLLDRKEARLIEQWLTQFRASSAGKGVVYLTAHAQSVDVRRVDGVTYMVLPPNGKAPYGPAENGGFNGWTLFGVDATPPPSGARSETLAPWVQAEVRPLFERAALDAPGTLPVGQSTTIKGTGFQPGGRAIPLRYPATVTWSGSDNLFIGSGTAAERAANSGQYAASFDPATGKLTALQPGEVRLRVDSNGTSAEVSISLDER